MDGWIDLSLLKSKTKSLFFFFFFPKIVHTTTAKRLITFYNENLIKKKINGEKLWICARRSGCTHEVYSAGHVPLLQRSMHLKNVMCLFFFCITIKKKKRHGLVHLPS